MRCERAEGRALTDGGVVGLPQLGLLIWAAPHRGDLPHRRTSVPGADTGVHVDLNPGEDQLAGGLAECANTASASDFVLGRAEDGRTGRALRRGENWCSRRAHCLHEPGFGPNPLSKRHVPEGGAQVQITKTAGHAGHAESAGPWDVTIGARRLPTINARCPPDAEQAPRVSRPSRGSRPRPARCSAPW